MIFRVNTGWRKHDILEVWPVEFRNTAEIIERSYPVANESKFLKTRTFHRRRDILCRYLNLRYLGSRAIVSTRLPSFRVSPLSTFHGNVTSVFLSRFNLLCLCTSRKITRWLIRLRAKEVAVG